MMPVTAATDGEQNTQGLNMPIMTKEERQQREAALASKIKNLLPDFVKACRASDDAVIIHQDSGLLQTTKMMSMRYLGWR